MLFGEECLGFFKLNPIDLCLATKLLWLLSLLHLGTTREVLLSVIGHGLFMVGQAECIGPALERDTLEMASEL